MSKPETAKKLKVVIPKEWPGAFGIFKTSKDIVMLNLSPVLTIISLIILIAVVSESVKEPMIDFLGNILTAILSVAFTYVLLAGTRSKTMSFSDAIEKAFSMVTVRYFLLSILTVLILLGSLILLIVPFFFVLPRIALAQYFLVDKDLGIRESLNASWDATKGHNAKFWGIFGATILMSLAILVIIGVYFVIMYSAAFAILYAYLTRGKQTKKPGLEPKVLTK